MFGETTVEFYLEAGTGPLSEVIRDSGLTLQWGEWDEKKLEEMRATVDGNHRTLGRCIAYSSLCATIAVMMLIYILESHRYPVPSMLAFVAFALIVAIGLVFCFPLNELRSRPTLSKTEFGMHYDDYVEHRISNTMETIRTAQIQEVYIHRLGLALLLQLFLMTVGVISLMAGAMTC